MRTNQETAEAQRAILRIQAGVLACVCGLLGGVGLFVMTAWLVLKGGPQVGAHLQLLGHYFIGYSVTWSGSFVGLFYGVALGSSIGWAVGVIYNRVVVLRQH